MEWPLVRPAALLRAGQVMRHPGEATTTRALDTLATAHSYGGDRTVLRALVEAALGGAWDEPWAFEAYRAGYLASVASRRRGVPGAAVSGLLALARDLAGGPGSRAGDDLLDACARVALAGYLGDRVAVDPAAAHEDLLAVLDRDLGADGAHRSGSPGLHDAALRRVSALLDAGLTADPRLVRARLAMEEALGWMVGPDGGLVPVGETRPRVIGGRWSGYGLGRDAPDLPYRDPLLRRAAVAGPLGPDPGDGWRVFTDAGLAVCRPGSPPAGGPRGGGYLAIQGGSARRRHADDLNVVWFDAGRWLLADPGHDTAAEGPDGRGPQSSRTGGRDAPAAGELAGFLAEREAHSTVAVTGATTTGAEITRWDTVQGVRVAEARAEHGPVRHERAVALAPGRWLLVADTLSALPGVPPAPGTGPAARVWFHAGAALDVFGGEGGLLMASEGAPVAWVAQLGGGWDPLTPARGRAPRLQGWTVTATGRPRPAWAFGWEAPAPARSAVVFSLAGPIEGGTADGSGCTWTSGGERVEVAWGAAGIAAVRQESGVAS